MATYRITAPDGGTYEVTAPDTASEAEVLAYAQKSYKAPEAPTPTKPRTLTGDATDAARDLAAGAVRGAGSIGATILSPLDWLAKKAGIQNDFIGRDDRREQMDAGLQTLGADTNSLAFKGGKLGAEIAGTAGIGGALAKPVMALANTRYAAGMEPIMQGVAKGLQTGGFRVGELAGTGAGTLARLGTGAASGGAMAGLVNPEDAGVGAVIGGALPGAAQLVGRAGEAAGSVLRGGAPKPNAEMLDTARRSMDQGYIIPPSMVNPSFKNRLLESQSGKFETAQLAATKNQAVTDSLARKALGMADDAPLSQEAMKDIRTNAGKVYEQIKGAGTIQADPAYVQALDTIKGKYKTAAKDFPSLGPTNMHGKPIDVIGDLVDGLRVGQFDSSSAIDAIGVLRETADKAFLAKDKTLGKAAKDAAKAMEDVIERHLQASGDPGLLKAFKDARQTIAKSYTVEKALREGAGTVDARVLGREVQRGKPLTGELLAAGQFGNVFSKAAQPPHLIGSPGVNTLKNTLAMVTSGLGGAAFGPAGLALGAVNYAAPPVARSLMFSPRFQRGLLDVAPGMLDEAAPVGLLANAYRSAPVLSAQ
jgi:hypothetical protein